MIRAPVAALLLVAGCASLAGCTADTDDARPAVPKTEAATALAVYDDPAEMARYAANIYDTRRGVATGHFQPVEPRLIEAMAEAGKAVWTPTRFEQASAAAPAAPADLAAAHAAFATALAQRAANTNQAYDRVRQADTQSTLPARFGVEANLLWQRMMAGYAAAESGRAASTDPRALAREIVVAGRAASPDLDALGALVPRAGDPNATGGDWSLATAAPSNVGADRVRSTLAAMPPADADRLLAWSASPAGKQRADAIAAAWARASDAAAEDMLADFFAAVRKPPPTRPPS